MTFLFARGQPQFVSEVPTQVTVYVIFNYVVNLFQFAVLLIILVITSVLPFQIKN